MLLSLLLLPLTLHAYVTGQVVVPSFRKRQDREYDTTFVWGAPGQGCYEACGERSLSCDQRSFRSLDVNLPEFPAYVTALMTDPVFDGKFEDLEIPVSGSNFCGLENGQTAGPSKSTAAPFRQVTDGKCFAPGNTKKYKTMRKRYKCYSRALGIQRFCGCKPSVHQAPTPTHVFQVASPRVAVSMATDGSDGVFFAQGWRPVTNTTCTKACRAVGLKCNAKKMQQVRGPKDMMALDGMLVERGWDMYPWYTPCRTYDARFFRALNPQHKFDSHKCWVNPTNRDRTPSTRKSARCNGVRVDEELVGDTTLDYNKGFRFCYCD